MGCIKFDIAELQAFVATAENSSFRVAAERLCLSAPALSRRVERLEEALGAKLLERTTRHVQLTAVGQEFLTEARAALESLESAAQRIIDQALTRRGSVTVACIPSVANHLLPNALRTFADEYPDVQVHVIDENASHVLDAVVRGRADFGLSFTGSQEPGIQFETLARERYVLAMLRSHAWACRSEVAWSELAGVRLVSVSHQSSNRLLLDQVMAGQPEQPMAWYECNHVTGALALVEAGLGMAAIPQLALPECNPKVCGVPLIEPQLWRTLGLIQKRERVLSPVAESLKNRLLSLHVNH
ncbi:LysR family transcriptional regulator [Comamonas testosteroni]|uniref:LysR family transcriptional regulator n=1 Tax=Comamonas testosteroni TaxID=285 RepID=A0A5A7ML00_COMTE|nr:LysR family transcriptional regulator [Comamonas testosteroni]GEQ78160.1 LysR family transcriptional regulator [Comamonas testosteroni]